MLESGFVDAAGQGWTRRGMNGHLIITAHPGADTAEPTGLSHVKPAQDVFLVL